ncbi:MAG: TauD/TfdA family dioxygenase, partial [Moorea sp. SIO2B7]|nr:TauD/TfdA family dioxygenase [Moorena sp. SIO2B7]
MKFLFQKSQQNSKQHHSRLGLEVLEGCNLSNLTDQQIYEFKESLWQHGVVVVRNQNITASQLEEFAIKTFGGFFFGGSSLSLDPDINPDIQSRYVGILGNPKGLEENPAGVYARKWHHDKDSVPRTEGLEMNALYVVMLYGVKVPPEG